MTVPTYHLPGLQPRHDGTTESNKTQNILWYETNTPQKSRIMYSNLDRQGFPFARKNNRSFTSELPADASTTPGSGNGRSYKLGILIPGAGGKTVSFNIHPKPNWATTPPHGLTYPSHPPSGGQQKLNAVHYSLCRGGGRGAYDSAYHSP